MPVIRKIERPIPVLQRRKRVAAYARVSKESERMMHSISAQVSYYNELIQHHPEWEYAGVYADDFISGTGIAKRNEFNRMLEDCEAGKIDIILTKSISRFARNTVDLLQTIRHLKDLGIEVCFEKENIRSLSGDGELMLSILASFAQEEVRSISENIKWRTRKRFEQGIPNCHFQIYGYRWDGDRLVVEPEEARIVKLIFQSILDGLSLGDTEKRLKEMGVKGCRVQRFGKASVVSMLRNITYTGSLLLQKDFVTDPIEKHRKINRGELPQYLVEDTHEAIIDKETFDAVQNELARRRALGPFANKKIKTGCFTGKVKCPHCGSSFTHVVKCKGESRLEYWICRSKKQKGSCCPLKGMLNQNNLMRACAEVLGIPEFDERVFLEKVDRIEVPESYVLLFHMKDGSTVRKECPNTGNKDRWTAEYRKLVSAKRRLRAKKKKEEERCLAEE